MLQSDMCKVSSIVSSRGGYRIFEKGRFQVRPQTKSKGWCCPLMA